MVYYAQSGLCRWKIILDYFGEHADWERCGACDNCRHPPEAFATPPKQAKRRRAVALLLPGAAVRVPKYGLGEVREASGETVSIAFSNGAVRDFLRSYVKPVDDAKQKAAR